MSRTYNSKDETDFADHVDSSIDGLLTVVKSSSSQDIQDKRPSSPPPTSEKNEKGFTLAEIKRRARQEAEEGRDDGQIRRFETINFTSDDHQLQETDLHVLYCAVCGSPGFVIEGDLKSFSVFEDAYVIDTSKTFYRSYLKSSDNIYIRRRDGIESRLLLRCTDCEYPVAYWNKTGIGEETTKFLYLFQDGCVTRQPDAAVLSVVVPKKKIL